MAEDLSGCWNELLSESGTLENTVKGDGRVFCGIILTVMIIHIIYRSSE